MPICYVNTNLPSSPMLENFATSFAEEIAKILKKPMERIRVVIESGQHLVVAGNADPAVLIRIYSIGVFDHNRNPGYTDHLVPFVSNALDVPPPRMKLLDGASTRLIGIDLISDALWSLQKVNEPM